MMEGYHKSVLFWEVLSFLQIRRDGWYLDATLGDGGVSLAILQNGGKVVGIDQDPQAIKRSGERVKEEGISEDRYRFIRGNFGNLESLIGDQKFLGEIWDLGVSSWQLDNPDRGFSFSKEAMLDMRMDPDLGVRALDLVNGLNKGELLELFRKYAERSDRRVVEAIVRERTLTQIETTTRLANIIEKAVSTKRKGYDKIHPATVYFQALRIAVNDELNNLKAGLAQALENLEKNGNLLCISFHSLEDRIVKSMFSDWQDRGLGEVITRKPVTPTLGEVEENPRSRSSKLRVFRKFRT